jgi:hypothetical protein
VSWWGENTKPNHREKWNEPGMFVHSRKDLGGQSRCPFEQFTGFCVAWIYVALKKVTRPMSKNTVRSPFSISKIFC